MEEIKDHSVTLHLRFIVSVENGLFPDGHLVGVLNERFAPLKFVMEDKNEKYQILVVAPEQPLFDNRGLSLLAMKQFSCGYILGSKKEESCK